MFILILLPGIIPYVLSLGCVATVDGELIKPLCFIPAGVWGNEGLKSSTLNCNYLKDGLSGYNMLGLQFLNFFENAAKLSWL